MVGLPIFAYAQLRVKAPTRYCNFARIATGGSPLHPGEAMKLDTPADRLRAARLAAGFRTAREFSDRHNIPQATYSLHETGGRGLRKAVAEGYARLLTERLPEVTADWLLYGRGTLPQALRPLMAGEDIAPGVREDVVAFQSLAGDVPVEPIVAALCPGVPDAILYEVRNDALNLDGIVPGDILIAEPAAAPVEGDLVIAQVYDWHLGTARTVLRRFESPYLLALSCNPEHRRPLRIDDQGVALKAIVRARFARFRS